MPVRLGCLLLWTRKPKIQIYRIIYASALKKLQVKNANTKKKNNTGAEQALTIECD